MRNSLIGAALHYCWFNCIGKCWCAYAAYRAGDFVQMDSPSVIGRRIQRSFQDFHSARENSWHPSALIPVSISPFLRSLHSFRSYLCGVIFYGNTVRFSTHTHTHTQARIRSTFVSVGYVLSERQQTWLRHGQWIKSNLMYSESDNLRRAAVTHWCINMVCGESQLNGNCLACIRCEYIENPLASPSIVCLFLNIQTHNIDSNSFRHDHRSTNKSFGHQPHTRFSFFFYVIDNDSALAFVSVCVHSMASPAILIGFIHLIMWHVVE